MLNLLETLHNLITQRGVDPSKDKSPMIDIKCELKLTNTLSLCFVHLVHVVINVYGGWTLADLIKMSMLLTREEIYRVVPPAAMLGNVLLNVFTDELLSTSTTCH
ncbi:hypothetical protein CBL_01752 [Carabus blaptoides fortunei]